MKGFCLWGMLACIILTACPPVSGTGNGPGTGGVSGVPIVFDNRDNPFRISVYLHSAMEDAHRIDFGGVAFIPPGQRRHINLNMELYPAMGLIPSEGFPFFIRYFIEVEGHTFFLDHRTERAVFGGVVTEVRIPAPREFFPADEPFADDVLLYLLNTYNDVVRLFFNDTIVTNRDGHIVAVNPRSNVLFDNANFIRPGGTSSFRVGTGFLPTDGCPFPPELPAMQRGHIYFLAFDGSALTLAREPIPLTFGE